MTPPGPRPSRLDSGRVVQLASKVAIESDHAAIRIKEHLQRDHPERRIKLLHVLEGLAHPDACTDPSRDRYSEHHRKWSYLIRTQVGGHRFCVCIAFDPPLPEEDTPVVIEIITAYFPDERDGRTPDDLR